jgi:hypothetical protein
MPQSIALSSLALLAAGGAMGGVYLGRSAVAEIDPAHYASTAPSKFYAELVPGGYTPGEARPLGEPGAEGFGDGCVNCRTYPVEYVPQHDGSVDAVQSAYPDPGSSQIDAMLAAVDRQIAEINRGAAVQRYASYPVEQRDEAPEASVEMAAAPAMSGPGEGTAEPAPVSAEAESGI